MSGTYTVRMGDRGRLVIPSQLRRDAGLAMGVPLILIDTGGGLVVMTRDQLKARVQADLEGLELVGELLDDREKASVDEDAI